MTKIITILRLFLTLVVITSIAYFAYSAYTNSSLLNLNSIKITSITSQPGFQAVNDQWEKSRRIYESYLAKLEEGAGKIGIVLSLVDKNTTLVETEARNQKEQIFRVGIKKPSGNLLTRFALIADSHSDNENLKKALKIIANEGISYVIGLGDYTTVGTMAELSNAKKVFDNSGLTYYLIPGDHDLWESRDKGKKPTANYEAIFGKPYQSFDKNGIRFILMDNTDNYLGVSQEQMEWMKNQFTIYNLQFTKQNEDEQKKPVFVFLHEPLYHPESEHVMGRVNEELKKQARGLLQIFAQNRVSEVFAGDMHFFARFTDSSTSVKITTVGSLSTQRNPQSPRFSIVSVYDDGGYEIEDRELE